MQTSRARVVCLAAVAWLGAVLQAAHAPANFSGTWMTDSTSAVAGPATAGTVSARGGSTPRALAGSPGPVEERLDQSGDRLTIDRRSAGVRQRYVYKLDGTESVNVNGRSTRTTTSRWDGEVLVTDGHESTGSAGGSIVNRFREVRSIDNTGAMLVEATRHFEGSGQTVSILTLVKKK